jgi:C1A family cysteine protease
MNRLFGWRPDVPDKRDYKYSEHFRRTSFPVRSWWPCHIWSGAKKYPMNIDLRTTGALPEVFDQGDLGSCVENSWCATMSYLEMKESNSKMLFSRLFMYYNVRGGAPVDNGSTIRDAIKNIALMGLCTEDLWPYDLHDWMVKPPDKCYAQAITRKDIQYARLETLDDMLNCLASGFPVVYGMSLYESFNHVTRDNPVLPLPKNGETMIGGHALTLVGYDAKDKLFLVRNSWGTRFGVDGYFYIPFDYVCDPSLADDFWTCRYIPS